MYVRQACALTCAPSPVRFGSAWALKKHKKKPGGFVNPPSNFYASSLNNAVPADAAFEQKISHGGAAVTAVRASTAPSRLPASVYMPPTAGPPPPLPLLRFLPESQYLPEPVSFV